MTVDRRGLASALAILLLVAACGGSATPSPTATPASEASQAPAASEAAAASEAPAASQEASAAPNVSTGPGSAADLEAMLPSQINGVAFQKTSFNGGIIPGGIPIGQGDQDLGKFLADNGKSLSDVSIAMASATGASALGSLVMAIQIKGMPSDKMLAWATSGSGDMPKTTLGGKDVYGAAQGGLGAFIYVKDDVLFYVLSMGGDPTMAEAIVKALP
jgi:hypothetical protein